jgi:hypothetical protein
MHTDPTRDPNARPTRGGVRLIAALVAGVLTLLGLAAVAAPATAAEIPGAITKVTTDKTEYGYSEQIKLTFAWSVPDGSRPGDTFTLALPDELAAASLAGFTLTAPDGTAVAQAAWSGSSVVFTLTDYVATHDQVGGTGFLTVQWDHTSVTETGGPIVLTFASNIQRVTIDPKPAPCTDCAPQPTRTERGIWKGSSWADGAYEGTRDEKDNINWLVEVPGDQVGYAGPVVVDDTIGAGSVIDCATLAVTVRNSLAGGTPTRALDPSRYTLECRAGGFTLTIDGVGASEFIDVTYKGTITDQSLGSYANTVVITAPGKSWTKVSTIKRTAAGGEGDGVQSVSVGDLVWLDTNRDGLQGADEPGIPGVTLVLTGPDGGPVTDVDGAAVPPVVTDADGHYLFTGLPVLPAGEHYTVTIDTEASAQALAGLSPTTAGAGDDRAADSSTGSAESTDLTTNGAQDLTLDFGFVKPAEPAGPSTSTPTPTPTAAAPTPVPDPSDTPAPAAATGTLAHTGLDIALPGLAAIALALLGGAVLLLNRRRQLR